MFIDINSGLFSFLFVLFICKVNQKKSGVQYVLSTSFHENLILKQISHVKHDVLSSDVRYNPFLMNFYNRGNKYKSFKQIKRSR